MRTICFATGLLARIANLDGVITDEEKEAIRSILAADWGLAHSEASILTDLACDRATRGLDYYRLTKGLFENTTIEERRRFLATLFRVANASNKTDPEEIEEIRKIAVSFWPSDAARHPKGQ